MVSTVHRAPEQGINEGCPSTSRALSHTVGLLPTPFDQEMLRRRVHLTLFGEPAWITTAEDCILHKLVWNGITPSDRQLSDAAGVVAVQGTNSILPTSDTGLKG
jgi:hypothetical protein